ncbi:hypothetical protein CASFOL_024084 [Castilleja foliolosa]|uniref:Uncharacterized protein n=1 Tax=Castilleja foliolosa TaxID=1961234 RepID=A0ABD3CMD2_9LAMI
MGRGPFIRIRREKGWTVCGPNIVNVLNNDEGLTYRLSIMDQNRDFLKNWIGLEKELAFVAEILVDEFVVDGL